MMKITSCLKVLLSLLPLIDGFRAGVLVAQRASTSMNNSKLFVFNRAVNEPTSSTPVEDVQRRNLLSSFLFAGSAGVLFGKEKITNVLGATTSSVGDATMNVLSVEQALEIIETKCDRRFLHAVVASNYNLIYRETTQKGISISSNDDEKLLESSPNVFQPLEIQLRDRPLQPSTSHLAVANADAAAKRKEKSQVASVWPLGENVHFAWMEYGTTFQGATDSSVIVDGIDCGRMSLEDALEGGKEILFRADQYLTIPVSMEMQLIQKLQGAFLI